MTQSTKQFLACVFQRPPDPFSFRKCSPLTQDKGGRGPLPRGRSRANKLVLHFPPSPLLLSPLPRLSFPFPTPSSASSFAKIKSDKKGGTGGVSCPPPPKRVEVESKGGPERHTQKPEVEGEGPHKTRWKKEKSSFRIMKWKRPFRYSANCT